MNEQKPWYEGNFINGFRYLLTPKEKEESQYSEAYREGYDDGATYGFNDGWHSYQRKDIPNYRDKNTEPQLPEFELIIDDEDGDTYLSDEDQYWHDEYIKGWNAAYEKHRELGWNNIKNK